MRGSSDHVRFVTVEKYIRPARLEGRTHFSVAVRDLMKDLLIQGFPRGNYPQICTAIRAGKFLKEQGLEIEGIDGPPKGLSPTVVVRYRLIPGGSPAENSESVPSIHDLGAGQTETRAERAHQALERLRGMLKDELAEYGGGEAFIRWIRSEGDELPAPGLKK